MVKTPERSKRAVRPDIQFETNTREYKRLLERLSDAVGILTDDCMVFANRTHLKLYGFTRLSEIVGKHTSELVAEEDRAKVLERAHSRARGEDHADTISFRVRRTDGTLRAVESRGMTVRYGGKPAILVVIRDVTEREESDERLRQALSLQRATLESTADGVLVMTTGGTIVDFNRRFVELWNLPDNFTAARDRDRPSYAKLLTDQLENPQALWATDQAGGAALPVDGYRDVLFFKSGRVFERYAFHQKLGNEVVGVVWTYRDVTERRRLEEQLIHQANHDPLTDLLNRRGFERELREVLKASPASGAVVMIDLDEFKEINDTLGHPVGDEVLMRLTFLLRAELGHQALISRLGGDEFAIIMPGATQARAQRTVHQILDRMRNHVFETSAGELVELTGSAGVVLFPEHGSTVEELMSRVDIALYRAKDHGRNRFSLYVSNARVQARAMSNLRLRHQIRETLEQDRLHLHAQPILDLHSRQISHYELLLRLPAEDGRLLPAAAFIEVAERSGLIVAIDRWVVCQAIDLLEKLQASGSNAFIEVNLSGRSVDDRELLRLISEQLASHRVDASRLIFEVTESVAIADVKRATRFIRRLKELGCRFALDDFGVGFSSLNSLQNLPVDYLKIDGSFIRDMHKSTKKQELIRAMVAIAGALDMKTIAEFVTNAKQAQLLTDLGVDYAQGYWVGRPRDTANLLVPQDAHLRRAA